MESLNIIDNEAFLRQRSKEVDFSDKSYLDDIKILEEYCTSNKVLAMASVQLGIPKRIIYLKNTTLSVAYDDPTYNEARVLINPTIISRKGHTTFWEACASCLDNTGLVDRPYEITTLYFDTNGNKKKEVFAGFESTVLSHEYDHLEGILHIDIAREIKILNYEERVIFRKEHPYEVISKDCDFEKVLKK